MRQAAAAMAARSLRRKTGVRRRMGTCCWQAAAQGAPDRAMVAACTIFWLQRSRLDPLMSGIDVMIRVKKCLVPQSRHLLGKSVPGSPAYMLLPNGPIRTYAFVLDQHPLLFMAASLADKFLGSMLRQFCRSAGAEAAAEDGASYHGGHAEERDAGDRSYSIRGVSPSQAGVRN